MTLPTDRPLRLNVGCGRNIMPDWVNVDVVPLPGVDVAGVHELVGNALVMKGEKERGADLRGQAFKPKEVQAHA